MFTHKVARCIVGGQPLRLHRGFVVVVAAIKKCLAISAIGIAGAINLRVPVITGKQFIRALAALYDFAMLGHFTREQVKGNAVMADHRLAHGAEGSGQLLNNLVLANAQLVMAGAVMLGDQIRVLEFVAALAACVLKTDRKSRQILHAHFAQQPHQQAGVDPAREQHAHIHSGALANGNRLTGAVQHAVAPVFKGQVYFVGLRAIRQRPPSLLLGMAIGVDTQPGGRWQFFDTGDQRARGRYHGMKVQIMVQCNRIEHRADIAPFEQCRQRGSKAQALAGTRQVERLDP